MNKPAATRCALIAMLPLLVSVAACSPPLQPSTGVSCPRPVTPPALPPSLAKAPPAESFSDAARNDISQWQQQLTNSATK